MAEILRGAPAAAAIAEELSARTLALKAQGVKPCLAILRLGERPDDLSYERAAIKRCEAIGLRVEQFVLDERSSQEQVEAVLRQINADDAIHGCLMFRPLPAHLQEDQLCELLLPEKDVDGMTALSLSTVFTGRGRGFAPCTAQAVLELLDHYGVDAAGKAVTVVGRSLVIGKPVSMMLQARNATVTMCHSRSAALPELCRRAEILVVAAGRAGVVDESFTNPGQLIVDVGVNAAPEGGICGDVRFAQVEPCVRAISPVPGGVGAVTAAVLCKHVVEAAEKTLDRG